MRSYTDTDLLAADFGHLAGFDFRVLPIPFRAELIPEASNLRTNDGALRILFLGDVREERVSSSYRAWSKRSSRATSRTGDCDLSSRPQFTRTRLRAPFAVRSKNLKSIVPSTSSSSGGTDF